LPAWLLLKFLWLLPRPAAISGGQFIARAAYHLHGRLRRVGHRNLELAMPELTANQRRDIVKGVFLNLGRLLGEFSQFQKLNQENVSKLVEYDGFENYKRASDQGRGVLMLT